MGIYEGKYDGITLGKIVGWHDGTNDGGDDKK